MALTIPRPYATMVSGIGEPSRRRARPTSDRRIVNADDQRLIAQCLDGDTAAFGALVRRYQDRLYHTVYGIRACAVRLTNTYGPGMRVKDVRQTFLGIWVRRLLEGQPIQVFGDGSQVRDFNHVDDWVPQRLVTATGPNPLPRFRSDRCGCNCRELSQHQTRGAAHRNLRTCQFFCVSSNSETSAYVSTHSFASAPSV